MARVGMRGDAGVLWLTWYGARKRRVLHHVAVPGGSPMEHDARHGTSHRVWIQLLRVLRDLSHNAGARLVRRTTK